MTDLELVTIPTPLAARHELTVTDLLAQAEKIKAAMTRAMEDGVHFGRIPGTPKPTLLKAGAEKLCLLFRLDPQYESTDTRDGEHLTVKSKCVLWHIPTSQRLGSGEGSCSTRESKYAYRKKGGERVPNPELADQWNTVLKMADKRALIAAVLNVTAASDLMTQDLEDQEEDRHAAQPTHVIPPAAAPTPRFDVTPLEDWIQAFGGAGTAESLQGLWKSCTAPGTWDAWTPDERAQLVGAKNAAKRRLGLD